MMMPIPSMFWGTFSFLLGFVIVPMMIYEYKTWRYNGAVFIFLCSCGLLVLLIMLSFIFLFKPKTKLVVRAADGEKKALKLMRQNGDSEKHAWQGAAALYHIMLSRSQTGVSPEDLFKLGAWDTLLSALASFPDSQQVAVWVLSAMTLLVKIKDVKDQIETEGGFQQIVSVMEKSLEQQKKEEQDPDIDEIIARENTKLRLSVSKKGCMVLGQAVDGRPALQAAAVGEGAVEAALAAMAWHRRRAGAQQWGSWALLQLTYQHPANKVYFLRKGGMSVLLDSLKNTPNNQKVQSQGLGVLANCLQPEEGVDFAAVCRAALHEGLEGVARAARGAFPTDAYLQDVSEALLQCCAAYAAGRGGGGGGDGRKGGGGAGGGGVPAPVVDDQDPAALARFQQDILQAFS